MSAENKNDSKIKHKCGDLLKVTKKMHLLLQKKEFEFENFNQYLTKRKIILEYLLQHEIKLADYLDDSTCKKIISYNKDIIEQVDKISNENIAALEKIDKQISKEGEVYFNKIRLGKYKVIGNL